MLNVHSTLMRWYRIETRFRLYFGVNIATWFYFEWIVLLKLRVCFLVGRDSSDKSPVFMQCTLYKYVHDACQIHCASFIKLNWKVTNKMYQIQQNNQRKIENRKSTQNEYVKYNNRKKNTKHQAQTSWTLNRIAGRWNLCCYRSRWLKR